MEWYSHQQKVFDRAPNTLGVFFDTGCGKTLTALELLRIKGIERGLIICPKPLKKQWERNVLQYGANHLVLTKEEFKRDYKTIGKFDAIGIDEAHTFAGYKSQLFKSLVTYIKAYNVKHVYALTATPVTATPYSVFAMLQILGRPMDFWYFTNKFFVRVRMGARDIWRPRKGIDDDLIKLLREVGVFQKMDEIIDLPRSEYVTEYFTATPEQKRAIAELSDEDIPVVRYGKIHQILNGTLKGDDGFTQDAMIKDEKTSRILEHVAQNKKIAIFCKYKLQIRKYYDAICEEFPEKKVYVISGDVKDRDTVVLEAEASDECVVLIQSQCSAGYELPSIGVCVFASLSYSYLDYRQACGRFVRINKPRAVKYINMICEAPKYVRNIDADVAAAIENKQDFYIEMYG
jgi:superfamily II DNA or RNA helicase